MVYPERRLEVTSSASCSTGPKRGHEASLPLTPVVLSHRVLYAHSHPRASPDGGRIAVALDEATIQIIDARDGAVTPFLQEGDDAHNTVPIWSPDSQQILFGSNRSESHVGLHVRRIDGTGDMERLTAGIRTRGRVSNDWSSQANAISFHEEAGATGWDVWVFELTGDRARHVCWSRRRATIPRELSRPTPN